MPEQLAPSAFSYSPASDRAKASEGQPISESRLPTWLDRHWQKFVWGIGLTFGAIGLLTGTIGIHVSGPPAAIAAIARDDTALTIRVTKLEHRADVTETSLKFVSYILCVNNRGNDPVVLDRCRPIIQSQGAP